MAKPFKIFLIIVGSFIGLIAVAAIAVPLLVNPNHYKGQISGKVHDAAHRELDINGDIKISVFPWLGVTLKDVVLGNAKGFGPEPFAQVGEMNVRVKFMPLLHRRVEVDTIHINGLQVNLAKAADGKNNWTFGKGEEKETPAGPVVSEEGKPVSLTVGGVAIKDAVFSYTDKQSGAAYKVDKLSVETGAIELGQPLDVTIAFLVTSAQPPLESDVKIAFTALGNPDTKVYELKNLKMESTTKGASVPGGSQKASLRGGANYDQDKGSFVFSDGVLEAAGLTLNAAVRGEGLSGDSPKLTGKISTNTFNPKEVAKAFGAALPPTSDPAALTQASFSTDIGGDPKNARLENLTLKLDQTTASGTASIKDFAAPVIQFALKADKFDADRYLAPAPAAKDSKPSQAGADELKKTEIPVDALDKVNANGTVALNSLKLKGMALTDILVTLDAPKGQVKTEGLTAKLYGGKIVQSTRITPGKTPRYDMKLGLDAVSSAPLLKDFLGKAYMSGLGTFNFNATSSGNTVGDILQALAGATNLNFKDGAVEGFNLDENLQKAKALYKGDMAAATAAATGPARTPFKDLKGAGKIAGGVLTTDTLNVAGSGYSLGGDGSVNLVNQTLEYVLNVSTDKYPELKGTKVPLKVSGSWFDPHVKVDLGGVVKGRAQQEVNKQVEKQEEKLKGKFGDFLNKKLGPKPAPAPAEPAPAEPAPAEPAPATPAPAEPPKQDAPSPGT